MSTLTRRLYTGFTLAFILVFAIGAITLSALNEQQNANEMVEHTYEVKTQADEVQYILTEMQAGRRGFRSTNEKYFLNNYYTGLMQAGPAIRELQRIVADNGQQAKRALALRNNIYSLIGFWQLLSNDLTHVTHDEIVRVSMEEQDRMNKILKQFKEFKDEELRLLQARDKKSATQLRQTQMLIIAGTAVIFIIIGILVSIILRELRTRRAAEATLQQNFDALEKANTEANERTWLLTGLTDIKDTIQNWNDLHSLAEQALTAITGYLNIPAAVFYYKHPTTGQLRIESSMGLEMRHGSAASGLALTVARTRKAKEVTQVPADYWSISSGSGKAIPTQLLLFPVCYNEELKGVIELASFGNLHPRTFELMKDLGESLAIALKAAEARNEVMTLLEEVQQQKEELQQQQEELRQTNEELTIQAEVLQRSEDELRVQEEELRQMNAELEEKNEAVEAAREALHSKAEELQATAKFKSEFLANMSHELRTPLNSILILARLLAENATKTLTPKQEEYAYTIHRSGNDLLQLINDVLDLSKLEAGKLQMHFLEIPLHEVISDMRQMFEPQATERQLNFFIEEGAGLPVHIQTDKLRLEQVLKNLLSNAFKFTHAGGNVTLSFSMDSSNGPALCMTVADTGIGIPADKQQLIFEAFQQADGSTSRTYGGTGLGLSISRELARKLGGYLKVESEEGKGSRFHFLIPLRQDEMLPVRASSKSQTSPKADSAQKTILIVEDDEVFSGFLERFAVRKGYHAVVASRGDEGLEMAKRLKPAAIILDMELPGISGDDLLDALSRDAALSKVPVHIISGMPELKLRIKDKVNALPKPLMAGDLEKVFAWIGNQLKLSYKKALVIGGEYMKEEALTKYIAERNLEMTCDFAENADEASSLMRKQHFDCLLIDLGSNIDAGVDVLMQLDTQIQRQALPVIAYSAQPLSQANEALLKKFADAIIVDADYAKDRLMDELELFIHHLGRPDNRRDNAAPLQLSKDYDVLKGKEVLIADDDMRNVFALSTLLEQYGMVVHAASDGQEALEMLEAAQRLPDIVLMDMMMPRMDGYAAMTAIRDGKIGERLPIIALTAKAMPEDRQKSISAGASDYVTKPVDTEKLLNLLRVWIGKRQS